MNRNFIFYSDNEETDFRLASDWMLTLGVADYEPYDFDEADDMALDDSHALASRLVSFAGEFNLSGDIWHKWIAYLLIMHENPLSLACERSEIDADSTMLRIAENDFEMLHEIFNAGPGGITDYFRDYKAPHKDIAVNNAGAEISRLASELEKARDGSEFCKAVIDFYESNGTGIYGLYRAFRIDDELDITEILPIEDFEDISFDTLIGCEDQTAILKENTEAFLAGGLANNILLYGDSGTGKSTSIHALIHDYYGSGLRMIEISKADRSRLSSVMAEIKKRNYKFILFLDDLSFEENESDYKELKAMLEGALETAGDHALIYATSNRRHLVREVWADRNDMEHNEDVHRSDTMEEKLSLASRFGITIYYGKPDYKEYMTIVRALSEREDIGISDEELSDEARKWSLKHGSTSGRTANQLIRYLKNKELQRNIDA